MIKPDKQAEIISQSLATVTGTSDPAPPFASSSRWQDLPSYEEAARQIDPPDINSAGVNRPSEELWHLFGRPDQAETELSVWDEQHEFEHIEARIGGNGNIVTHAAELNNPITLEKYVRHQALKRPRVKLICKGTHQETRHKTVSDGKGGTKTESETYTETDFNFSIDLSPIIQTLPLEALVLSTPAPSTPSYRGTHSRTFDPHFASSSGRIDIKAKDTDHGKRSSWSERRVWKKWTDLRRNKGYPVWWEMTRDFLKANEGGLRKGPRGGRNGGERSQEDEEVRLVDGEDEVPEIERAALSDWCKAFCASKQPLKKFKMKKEVWGWNQEGLLIAVKGAIRDTGYNHTISVCFQHEANEVEIHPDTRLSRMMTHPVWKVILIITLIYPILWIISYFFAGGRWEIVTASYPFKCYLPATQAASSSSSSTSDLRYGPPDTGMALFRLHGVREGKFLRDWEDRIRNAVVGLVEGDLGSAQGGGADAEVLDGYRD